MVSNTVKKYLLAKFWAGQRWIVFDPVNKYNKPSVIECFMDYRDAEAYCADWISPRRSIRIRVLSSVLKELNGIKSQGLLNDEMAIMEKIISRYPIRTFCN